MNAKLIKISAFIILACGVYGCALLKKPIEFAGDLIDSTFSSSYSGPKARVIVADFEVMSAKATTEISGNLRDLLTNEIVKTKRFQVVSLPKDSNEKPEGLIIAIQLLDFEPYGSGGKSGIGGGGSSASGVLGSLLGSGFNKSYVTLNIRIVDSKSSKVLSSGRISGQAAGDVPYHRDRHAANLGQGLAVYSGTSMEGAINQCVTEAVRYIVQNVPAGYYKGGDKDGKT